jgi:subtilisin family serine protease
MHFMTQSFFTLCLICLSSMVFSQSRQALDAPSGDLKDADKQTWFYTESKKAYGTQASKVRMELLTEGKAKKKKIVVAVIDSGVDDEHEDLNAVIWTNPNEVANNGLDDDGNGLIDDVHGWNYLVDASGNNYVYDNMEATRVLRISKNLEEAKEPYPTWLTKEVLEQAATIFNESTEEMKGLYQFAEMYRRIDSAFTETFQDSLYTYEQIKELKTNDALLLRAQVVFKLFHKIGLKRSDLQGMQKQYNNYKDYYLNLGYQTKADVASAPDSYGNNYIGGAHTGHGTHVAGIIGAAMGNELGIEGIAGAEVEIMVLKVVPDGDELDMDVANAIRYAADHGAHIVNMSFGKGISPAKGEVYQALEYAASKKVLLIHAAGNDSENSDEVANYPNDEGISVQAQQSYLCIGALAPHKGKKMVATFSNYGSKMVDLFAPGEDIYSTLPGNKYGYRSGTSMAAPVVSGVAALVWAYHRELSAVELAQILLESGTDLSAKKVIKPGSDEKVPFAELCTSGRVINAYEAFRLASSRSLK